MAGVSAGNFGKLEIAFFALLAGVVVPMFIGFDGGFWVTKVNAQRMAHDAVMPVRAALCVAQFSSGPNYQDRLKEYKALDSTAKGTYIGKGGWAKMAGEEKTSDDVMQACGSALDK